MNTKLTELLGIEFPVLQGAMAWVSESRLVSAVSNAGGAGIIAAGGRTCEWVQNEIRATKRLTSKPFGINIVLAEPTKDGMIDIAIEEKLSFVTLSAGNPVPFIARLKEGGVKVIPVVPHLKGALKVEAAGADAVVIEGMEAGGIVGSLGCMSLMTNVIPQVKIPVVAAGGMADGRGVLAALVMGACGVQMGSIFMLADECIIPEQVKQKIIQAIDTDSVITGYGTAHATRGIKNAFSTQYLKMMEEKAPSAQISEFAEGSSRGAFLNGDVDNGFVAVSSSLNALTQTGSAREIIEKLMNEVKAALVNVKAYF